MQMKPSLWQQMTWWSSPILWRLQEEGKYETFLQAWEGDGEWERTQSKRKLKFGSNYYKEKNVWERERLEIRQRGFSNWGNGRSGM